MDVYNNIAASIKKHCKGFIDNDADFLGFQTYDFDAFATENDMPSAPLIGIAEYSLENLDRQYIVTCMICICTTAEDTALKLIRKLTGKLMTDLQVGAGHIRIVNATTGVDLGNLVIMDNVKALPVARTDTRPVQMIAISFGAAFLTPP